MAATIREMAGAVNELTTGNKQLLVWLENQSYRQGVQPGPDLAFAGPRINVARCEEAARFLIALAPYEDEFRDWFAAAIANRLEAAAASPSRV